MSILFRFLYSVKKRKKYTSIFGCFRPLNIKKQAPKQLIDRSEARFYHVLPIFSPYISKMTLKTSFAVVDKRGFYYGCYVLKRSALILL